MNDCLKTAGNSTRGPFRLDEIAFSCMRLLKERDSSQSALASVAELVEEKIGPLPGRAVLERPDPVSSAFIELLDQIVFEMQEGRGFEVGRVEEYILGDLYRRLEIFLSLCEGPESYRKGLGPRAITADDALIIRHYRLTDFAQRLVSVFWEQPHLRFPVLFALVSFESEDLIGFFYEIARAESGMDLRVLAVLGLHLNESGRFDGWDMLEGKADRDFNLLIRHVRGFTETGPPSGVFLLFSALKMEIAACSIARPEEFAGCLSSMQEILGHGPVNGPLKQSIYGSLSRTLGLMRREGMRAHLADENNLKNFIQLAAGLPYELIGQASILMDYLRDEIMSEAERILFEEKIHSGREGSRLSAHLLTMGFDPFLS